MEQGALSGKSFGKYHLRHLLGRGGMGEVYFAHQQDLDRDVAFKVLRDHAMDDHQRFLREAKIAASLEHPHIVPIYDYGVGEGSHYIVMRVMLGGTLESRLLKGPLPVEEMRTLLNQVAKALDHSHSRGIIHRDIKPSNVLFDLHSTAYLSDFGIAKLLDATGTSTTQGQLLGTPAFMAPELWRNEPASAASDVYALGVLVYRALTGEMPFKADTPYSLMVEHLYGEYPSLHAVKPDLSPAIQSVLAKALAKDPRDRYATAGAFHAALSAVAQYAQDDPDTAVLRPTADLPPTPKPKRTRTVIWLVAAVLLMFLVWRAVPGSIGISPTTTPTASATSVVVLAATATRTATVSRTPTPPPTQTPTLTSTLTPTFTSSPTATATATSTASPTVTHTPTSTATNTATSTPTDTPVPSHTAVIYTGPVTPSLLVSNGALTEAERTVQWDYEGQAGQVISVCLRSQDFDAHLTLQEADGSRVISDDFGGTTDACLNHYMIRSTGVYHLIVSSLDRQSTGDYGLEVTTHEACSSGLPIAIVAVANPVNLRSLPTTSSALAGIVISNECFAIVGQGEAGNWWKVRTADGRMGWIAGSLVAVIGPTEDVDVLSE